MHTYQPACMDGWINCTCTRYSLIYSEWSRSGFFFLSVCHMKFTSPFQFHAPLLFIENLPTVPYGQVHETTYLLHQIRSWEYGHDLGR